MAEYRRPGVYIQDVSSGAHPITGVGTSTAAFLGVAPQADAHLRKPVFVTSWPGFQRRFQGDGQGSTPLSLAVDGFFQNGGARLYVVNLGQDATTISADDLETLSAMEGISLIAAPGFTDADSVEAILTNCETRKDRFAVLDMAEGGAIADLARTQDQGGLRPRNALQGMAAVYAPWIEVRDPETGEMIACPPSGHICGAYAGNDSTRGVHHAPANLPLRGALGLSRLFTDADQDILAPACVNAIRQFSDGIRIWGARTLTGADSEWRYVNIRRLLTLIELSIQQGTRWAVFEPNDDTLWKSIRRDVWEFLNMLWRDGALMGSTTQEAFFVRCDATTMTQADLDAGRLIIEIGVAPVRPAEFVVIRIMQTTSDSEV
ncbi:phage tail sheath subtilisin-like domain-containing protein [Mameliella sp. AT18]|uniref:phage tail sheath family protein n=1 Tax=Mameliella sp. AT18 TaxID=3028385 RepID=UPI00084110D1|nr:phage tail sheath C-terminal domain-containing protein [Mameliella sp. AT18]MDD9731189.1 phage tail sheath subtilisin-like domain-containing protein [Mameliella sp. AT18]ODM50482.1 hypothetical protein A9320_01720 [Ruegeria sp. PBVC088]